MPHLSSSGSDRYEILTVTCATDDSFVLERWIADTLQTPVLVEDGPPSRLSFGCPAFTSLEILLLDEALRSLGAQDFRLDSFERKDWQELWKEQGFKRFSVGRGHLLTILPAWDYDPAPTPKITIDPHVAFGTGWHETTRQCLELVWEISQTQQFLGKVLDFGSGTGILGIAALRLDPAATLVAIDNDPYAVEATTANLAQNGLEERGEVYGKWDEYSSDRGGSPFQLVLANVTEGVVITMAESLWERVSPGGWFILSGVAKNQGEVVEKKLRTLREGFESYPGHGYHTYRLRKDAGNE